MQVRRAIADNVLSIYRFEDVLGPKFKRANLPMMDAFMEKLHADQRAILIAAKNALKRPRPAAAGKEVLALGGTPRLPTAYPSGGVVMTTLTAIVLSKMIPEKQFELSERNLEYAVNRVVLGQHFPGYPGRRNCRNGDCVRDDGDACLYARPGSRPGPKLRQVLDLSAEPVVAGPDKTK